MEGAFLGQAAGLVLFVVAVLVAHELAHVVVARAYGYPVVCLGLSPLAVGIVFLDQPVRRYWLLHVSAPMTVTAAVTYLVLFVLPPEFSASRVVFAEAVQWQLVFSVVLAALTSSGDVASMIMELRRPIWGRERVVRDVRMLQQIRSLLRFTDFGRRYLAEEFGLSPREFTRAIAAPGATREA